MTWFPPSRIHDLRALLLWVSRLTSAVLTLVGGVTFLARMIQFMLADAIQPQRNYRVWAQLGYDEVISWSIGQILAGLTLAFCSQAALRWIIRPPEMGCPRCGYAVGDGTDTCPECGQTGVG